MIFSRDLIGRPGTPVLAVLTFNNTPFQRAFLLEKKKMKKEFPYFPFKHHHKHNSFTLYDHFYDKLLFEDQLEKKKNNFPIYFSYIL